jgi:hypothetical protein
MALNVFNRLGPAAGLACVGEGGKVADFGA